LAVLEYELRASYLEELYCLSHASSPVFYFLNQLTKTESSPVQIPVLPTQWLTPVILAAQEAEIRRIRVPSQPRQIVCETLSQETPSQKRAGGVAQGVGPEFKP
jgi:hypothetical protein